MNDYPQTPTSPTIPVSGLNEIAEAAERSEQPGAVLDAVARVARSRIGYQMLSISVFRPESRELERIYSTNANAYPVGGRKTKRGTSWAESVLDRGEVFFARSRNDLQAAFDDYEKIFALGFGTIINVPIRWRGTTLGTMNFSEQAGRYDEEDVETARAIGVLLIPALLMHYQSRIGE